MVEGGSLRDSRVKFQIAAGGFFGYIGEQVDRLRL